MAKACNVLSMKYIQTIFGSRYMPQVSKDFSTLKNQCYSTGLPKLMLNKSLLPTCTSLCRKVSSVSEEDGYLDDNDRALKELDITLLKPHPEWRNVAAGPVWGEGDAFYKQLWEKWLESPALKKQKEEQDKTWDDYVEMHGQSPLDYVLSEEFLDKYLGKYTWHGYFRNRKGFIQPQKTRRSCKKNGVITTGSPCPLCRDDMLLVTYKTFFDDISLLAITNVCDGTERNEFVQCLKHKIFPQNIPLLKEYIDHQTGELHSSLRTGLCQLKQRRLKNSFELAQQLGYFPRIVPFVKFDPKDYKLNPHVL